jgi:hypothetical protein
MPSRIYLAFRLNAIACLNYMHVEMGIGAAPGGADLLHNA